MYLGPDWLFPVIAAPFVGSFLGVVALRLPRGQAIALARSACPHCARRLAPWDMVPVLSWLVSRGRCRYCGARLGAFYPLIELAALVPVLWAAAVMSGWLFWATCLLGWFLLVLAAVDLRHQILPDALTFPLIGLGIAVAYFADAGGVAAHLIGAAAGFAVFAAIALAYERLRGRAGLGLGDAKLLAVAGAWVSWNGLASVVLIGAATALVVALGTAMVRKNLALDRRIPLGPYLGLAIWVVWLHGPLTLVDTF